MQQDKKKIMVLAALAVAIVAVGAFQMTRPVDNPAPVASKEKGEEPKTEEPTEEGSELVAEQPAEGEAPLRNPQLAQALPPRDPFKEASLPGGELASKPNVPPVPQNVPKIPRPTAGRRPRGNVGTVPPFQFDSSGQIPGVGGGAIGVNPAPELDAFSYQVSGVIVGKRSAAVFTDSQGNQRLVSEGSSIDGDSKVVKVDKGQVVIKHRGKTLRLTVGGTP